MPPCEETIYFYKVFYIQCVPTKLYHLLIHHCDGVVFFVYHAQAWCLLISCPWNSFDEQYDHYNVVFLIFLIKTCRRRPSLFPFRCDHDAMVSKWLVSRA